MNSGEASPHESTSSSPCESPVPDDDINEEFVCPLCNDVFKQPRLLTCLHRYCTQCIEDQVETDGRSSIGAAGEDGGLLADDPLQLSPSTRSPATVASGTPARSITCMACKQVTQLSEKGVTDLPLDYVLVNALDMCAIEKKQIVCTSCKAKEKAVARCQDCANFLCPNCVTAHQYMRCFENHKVESFEDMQKQSGEGVAIHKPLFCSSHGNESMKYFCTTCQTPICTECIASSAHPPPEHVYQRIGDVEDQQRQEVTAQVAESRAKIATCEEASDSLDCMLSELQMQRDNAKGLVEETYQSYKAILDKKKEATLEELEKLHSAQELSIMEVFHNVEKTIEKIEDGCKFSENVVKCANGTELLLLKKTISTQLLSLINNTPKPEVDIKIEFHTDIDTFQQAIEDTFGTFKKPEETKDTGAAAAEDMHSATSLHSSFENEAGLNLPTSLLGSDAATAAAAAGLLSAVTPTDLAGGLTGMLPPLTMPPMSTAVPGVSQQTINNIASSLQNLSHTDRSSSRNSYSPAMSDSGISIGGEQISSSSSGSRGYNVSALAKLGTLGVNSQGQVTLNGQVLPGIDVHNADGLPPGIATSANHPPSTPTDFAGDPAALANFLSSMNMPPPPNPSTVSVPGSAGGGPSGFRPTTPQLTDVGNLFSPTSFNGMGSSVGPTGSNPNLMATPSEFAPMVTGLTLGSASAFKPPGQPPYPVRDSSKMTAMQIRCKFGQLGPGKGQFNSPHGFCLGMDEDIVTADTNNHRIQVFEKTGEYKYQFGIPGRDEGQLWYPRKVAVIRSSGRYVVCDRGNERSRMQLFTRSGHFIRKIAIRYIDIVAGLAITQEGHIAAVDSVSPTVFVIDPESSSGELVRWFDCSDYMREPSDIAIRGKEYYVCDFKGHCVVAFNEEGQYLRRIGCDTITNYPNGIDVSDAGDILVGDSHGNRFHVAVFSRQGELTGEFQCPYVKVSRCCGLKITSEGYVVTLAKNNHHVLVLGTLYLA